MHRNPVWIGFLILVTAVTAFFTWKALFAVYDFSQLDRVTKAKTQHFEIKQVALDAYAPIAFYTFSFSGKTFSGNEELSDYSAANPDYAEEQVTNLNPLTVYFSSSDPSINALSHNLPFGLIIRATLLIALTAYFLWLGSYVKTHSTK